MPTSRRSQGLPGGMRSPLYSAFEKENTWGMELKEGVGRDADAFNVVWVYDTTKSPFFDGEVYHQFHCNVSHSRTHERFFTCGAPLGVVAPLVCAFSLTAPSRVIVVPQFFMSEGMPYPPWYTRDLWESQQRTGRIKATGCPEAYHPPTC